MTNVQHTSNVERKPTKTHGSVASPPMGANPGETAHASAAPESDPDRLDYQRRLAAYIPDQLAYYGRLAAHMFMAVAYILMSSRPNTHSPIVSYPHIYATLAKIILISVVAYLPGPLELRLEVSDICQWVCFILCLVISVIFSLKLAADSFIGFNALRLCADFMSFLFALSWRNTLRTRYILYLPHRVITALLQGQGSQQHCV